MSGQCTKEPAANVSSRKRGQGLRQDVRDQLVLSENYPSKSISEQCF